MNTNTQALLEALERIKSNLMHTRRFGVDDLGTWRRAATQAEGDIEELLASNPLAPEQHSGEAVAERLVPVEPTSAMSKAAADAWLDCGSKLILNKASAALKAGINAARSK